MTFATAVVIVAYFDLSAWANDQMETVMANQESNESIWSTWWVRSLLALAGSTFAASIGYTSFYTGANSANQVLLGFQLGVWIATVFHCMIRDYLFESI